MTIELINFLKLPYEKALETRLWRNSEDVAKYFKIKNISEEAHKKWLASLQNENPTNIAFMIKTDDDYVGVTYFHSIKYAKKQADWGIYIYQKNLRGLGIGKSVLMECIKYAQQNLFLDMLFLDVLDNNDRAIKLYENLGFIKTDKDDGLFLRYQKSLLDHQRIS